jgi:peptide/nickel transport system permease protein
MLLVAFTYVLGKGIFAVYIALGVTNWVSLCRLIRGEFIKHKSREYVLAAESIGATHGVRIFRHILPNVIHIVIINLSLQFQTAIKTEVILSYLGLGAQGQPSWGVMIDDAKLELARGVWWQLTAATAAMFFIVLAFNIFGDALRDALDPKLKKG